jgi:hypothetical protein
MADHLREGVRSGSVRVMLCLDEEGGHGTVIAFSAIFAAQTGYST